MPAKVRFYSVGFTSEKNGWVHSMGTNHPTDAIQAVETAIRSLPEASLSCDGYPSGLPGEPEQTREAQLWESGVRLQLRETIIAIDLTPDMCP
jgi:hypothetical protein